MEQRKVVPEAHRIGHVCQASRPVVGPFAPMDLEVRQAERVVVLVQDLPCSVL
jgi:hypothetical protein